jgi:hypothetical protein
MHVSIYYNLFRSYNPPVSFPLAAIISVSIGDILQLRSPRYLVQFMYFVL